MIDIHCHILNSIDDGAEDLSESVRMVELAEENSIEKIILTPHIRCSDDIEDFIQRRDSLIEELKSTVGENTPELFKGAEVYANDDIFYANIEKLTLAGSKYLLVEFDFMQFYPAKIEKYFKEILSLDLVPIFAHPERYSYCQMDYNFLNFLYDMGVLFQVNAPSLAGLGSREEFYLAKELIEKQVASFIATDAHSSSVRSNRLLKMISDFPESLDTAYLDYVFNEAPKLIIENKEIERKSRGYIKK